MSPVRLARSTVFHSDKYLRLPIYIFTDTSKRRGVMRGKLTGIKKRLENATKDYLNLIQKPDDRDLSNQIREGILPWQTDPSLQSEGIWKVFTQNIKQIF